MPKPPLGSPLELGFVLTVLAPMITVASAQAAWLAVEHQ
jgi:hypothetical protein